MSRIKSFHFYFQQSLPLIHVNHCQDFCTRKQHVQSINKALTLLFQNNFSQAALVTVQFETWWAKSKAVKPFD